MAKTSANEIDKYLVDVSLSDTNFSFAEEYLRTYDAEAAYKKTFPNQKVSNVLIWKRAQKILNQKSVRTYIAMRREEEKKDLVIDTHRVLSEMAAMAFTNITDVIEYQDPNDPNSIRLKSLDKLTSSQKKAIKKLNIKKTPTRNGEKVEITVEMHDKHRSLETLCKHTGLINEAKTLTQNNVTNNNVVVVRPEDLTEEQLKAVIDGPTDND